MGAELLFCASSLHATGRYLPKRYVLRGDIGLTYEERWVDQTEIDKDFNRFTHNYNLGFSGFVIDPRLITFDVDGTLSEEINFPNEKDKRDAALSNGFNVAVNFLNKPARRGFFSHFPQPIIVSYGEHDSEFSRVTNYGISFGYDFFERIRIHRQFQQRQQQQQFRRQQQIMQQINANNANNANNVNNVNNVQGAQGVGQFQNIKKVRPTILPLPLPILYFDYDHYSYSFPALETDTDIVNVRLVDQTNKTQYNAEYNYQLNEGTGKLERQNIYVDVNYRDYWREKNERFSSFNNLDLVRIEDGKNGALSSDNTWTKGFGNDFLTVAGGGSYGMSNSASDSYAIRASSQYTKNLPNIRSLSGVAVNYGDSGTDEIYLAELHNETTYDFSRRLSLTGRGNIGRNELGEVYGAGVGLQVLTFIRILPEYNFSRRAASEGRTTNHDFRFDLEGRIARELTFNSRNSYEYREVSGEAPVKEKILDLRVDLFWRLRFMNINLGVSRLDTNKKSQRKETGAEEAEVDFALTSAYSTLSMELYRNMFMTLNSSYTTSENREVFILRPVITWNMRQVILSAEYELKKRNEETNTTEHRVFFRLTRTFARLLRNPW
jgi:hypothetical protein